MKYIEFKTSNFRLLRCFSSHDAQPAIPIHSQCVHECVTTHPRINRQEIFYFHVVLRSIIRFISSSNMRSSALPTTHALEMVFAARHSVAIQQCLEIPRNTVNIYHSISLKFIVFHRVQMMPVFYTNVAYILQMILSFTVTYVHYIK